MFLARRAAVMCKADPRRVCARYKSLRPVTYRVGVADTPLSRHHPDKLALRTILRRNFQSEATVTLCITLLPAPSSSPLLLPTSLEAHMQRLVTFSQLVKRHRTTIALHPSQLKRDFLGDAEFLQGLGATAEVFKRDDQSSRYLAWTFQDIQYNISASPCATQPNFNVGGWVDLDGVVSDMTTYADIYWNAYDHAPADDKSIYAVRSQLK